MTSGVFRLGPGQDWTTQPEQLEPGVTVILRTKDRPIFLRRALESIVAQDYPDLTLCLVNDGGDRQTVETIARSCLPTNLHLETVHHEQARGQPAALNAGFARVRRQFFAVHDDDDTWAPAFLKKMTAFLQEPRNQRFIGAVCYADEINEVVTNGTLTRASQRPYLRQPPVLSLIDLLLPRVHPPPISQLMRYAALTVGGPMNLDMPVMYDFEWTIRVMLQADIATLPETLAYYHFRHTGGGTTDSARNSVFAYEQEYRRLSALLRNQLLREELSHGHFGAGFASSIVHLIDSGRRLDITSCDQIRAYLMHRARGHARRRRIIRGLEAPLRFLRDKWFRG